MIISQSNFKFTQQCFECNLYAFQRLSIIINIICMSDKLFEVEEIVGRRKGKDGDYEYLVKWKAYSFEECTWESIKNLESVIELVADFEIQRKRKDSLKRSQNTNSRGNLHKQCPKTIRAYQKKTKSKHDTKVTSKSRDSKSMDKEKSNEKEQAIEQLPETQSDEDIKKRLRRPEVQIINPITFEENMKKAPSKMKASDIVEVLDREQIVIEENNKKPKNKSGTKPRPRDSKASPMEAQDFSIAIKKMKILNNGNKLKLAKGKALKSSKSKNLNSRIRSIKLIKKRKTGNQYEVEYLGVGKQLLSTSEMMKLHLKQFVTYLEHKI